MKARSQIIYVASYPRSGSTLLGMMLGAYEGTAFVGEVSSVFTSDWQRDCSCSRHDTVPMSDCPIWSDVLGGVRSIFESYGIYCGDNGLDKQTRSYIIPHALKHSRTSEKEGKMDKTTLAFHEAVRYVYRELAERLNVSALVDTSKRMDYCILLNIIFSGRLFNIYVERNVKGVVYSSRKRPSFTGIDKPLDIRRVIRVASGWAVRNALSISRLHLAVGEYSMVYYDELCASPRLVSDGLMRKAVGGGYKSPFVNNHTFVSRANHAFRANRLSRTDGQIAVSEDTKWKSELAPLYRNAASVVGVLMSPLSAVKYALVKSKAS